MPDFLKKAAKRANAECGDDETTIAALFCRPRTGEQTRRLGAPGGATEKVGQVTRLADGSDTDAEGDMSPQAARQAMFAHNVVLVLTTERLLGFGHGTYTGRVRKLTGQIALSDIESMDLEAPPIGQSGASALNITFTDGQRVELTPGSRRRRFVEAFEKMGQPV